MEFLRTDETLDDLQLKGIHVIQKKHAFRFGVDAVLLANFVKVRKNAKVVDLCTGTGIIPFILAGKTTASNIIGVEIQEEFVDMANRSIEYNNLEDKIKFINGDLKDIELIKGIDKVDIVTVNPPYKLQNSGLISLNDKDAIARHEICCTLEDVIIACRILLKDNGRMYMVHRPDRLADILCTMRKHRIEPKRIRMVHPSVNKAPNIVLIEGQRDGGAFLKWDPPLYVHVEDGGYTEEIKNMYKSDGN
ncbi:tRNA1(Val) (adenine(37)-N6)-methyltransferase [Clostridium estertheticum]|uniref:tRNA1(Val) (adenine(37)-N6)-methyltransferase n=1 Tax=Clostridium estertheticum TaxID=238834 RepID=UPI001C7D2030|nr:tRNA1(Val) (adenine(37)-N6)-methyltransferase [Clostridium estertheticum]MBX4261671.1 tRNA1(Val) (adenine(37)-N6)-methyltransferase [Clostridium estertheticum]MBX4266074.1 tRNA1(Val) (adenine(37)-N6)-methyltransferase [Clostridium estertheticum]MBX4270276.1 tRNA1(Val) (adenine(37)-N6)-methyltransferase [Clostridium estertheticum]WLC70282.1 tRNA1(Val) (adenine(37)-N6)-methyltransferase [Clostridium estertheticum]WLC80821.1 tRNA1(Val) (adenine(37)-N6)-methyltransferase [Clostridium estertheti